MVVRYLDKGVAETLADTLDGDFGVTVVVTVIVADSNLHKGGIGIDVSKVFALFSRLFYWPSCYDTPIHVSQLSVKASQFSQCNDGHSPACCGTARERSDASGSSRNTRSLRCRTLS